MKKTSNKVSKNYTQKAINSQLLLNCSSQQQ